MIYFNRNERGDLVLLLVYVKARRVKLRVGDSLLFDATALHGIEDLGTQPVSYLSIVFTLRG